MTQHRGWYPVALAGGVEIGTSLGTHLHGEEIVVWRDADGAARAWEDRCPHRGMRLSMGFVRADRIACLYHGWQYGTDGHCLYIPAHPEIQVPRTIVTWRHTCAEALGMIWMHFGDATDQPSLPAAAAGRNIVPVRSLFIDKAAEVVADQFASVAPPRFLPEVASEQTNRPGRREGSLVIHTLGKDDLLIGAVHPVDAGRSALHLVIAGDEKEYRGAGQLLFSRFAQTLRDSIELGAPMPAAEQVLA